MLQNLIIIAYALILAITPFLWNQDSYELFEFNKMIFVYLGASMVGILWVLRMVREKRAILRLTPLDLPILLFLVAATLSTVFSTDPHTSWWGYYSRSNGGLWSLISYTILYFGFTANITVSALSRLLKVMIFAGVAVSLYAIPEHFGRSPSCFLLQGSWTADCWVQDVQARVFATLGQPNWLAAYLAMIIFPALYFLMTSRKIWQQALYLVGILLMYAAFTYTYSRGATLGLLAGAGGFGAWFIYRLVNKSSGISRKHQIFSISVVSIALVGCLLINIVSGSAFHRFNLLNIAPPPTPTSPGNVTQLENGGTESGQIRLIVWKGALEIFKNYPVLGSGLETFAYSYYKYRPAEHNLVSEWDFLYNKAHNEYLNYLATTGIVGITTYLLMIGWFVVWTVRYLLKTKHAENDVIPDEPLLVATLFAGYISYLVQNATQFSVVIIAVLFYLYPAAIFVATGYAKNIELTKIPKMDFYKNLSRFFGALQSNNIGRFTLIAFPICLATLAILQVVKFSYADTLFAEGVNYSEEGSAGKAFLNLETATRLRPNEPFYHSELGFAAASAAVLSEEEEASDSAEFTQLSKQVAIQETDKALQLAPANVSFWRTAIRTYYQLSAIDPSFNDKTLQAMDKVIELAPTDAKIYYNKALILGQMDRTEEGLEALKKSVELKPNYREGHMALGLFYRTLGQKDLANQEMQIVLTLVPNDPEALAKLEEWAAEDKVPAKTKGTGAR